MQLVIFDIDGTLTRTNEADEACFAQSMAEEFGIKDVSTNWSDYAESTDSGILDELLKKRRGQGPTTLEILNFQKRFVQNLNKHAERVPDSFNPVAGSPEILSAIPRAFRKTHVAIATGAWKPSALFKLSRASLPTQSLPAAYADDHLARAGIVRRAIERARETHGVESFQRVVYVGDGRWDFLATQQLGIDFVGVTDHRDPNILSSMGAKNLIKDYSDQNSFLKLLERIFDRPS